MTPEEKAEIVQLVVEILQREGDRPPSELVKKKGKEYSLLFAAILSVFMVYQVWSYERDGDRVPVVVWSPLMGLIGLALGVQVNPEAIGRLVGNNPR